MAMRLAVTGRSLYLPGVRLDATLAGVVGGSGGDWRHDDAPPPDRAAVILGRKGLLYKEPSTRLALCAVHRALGFQPGQRPDQPMSPTTAVVACGNLGNVETVAQLTRTIAAEGGQAVSVLDAPNASSNVIASTVAMWFGFGGPNLMVCSGSTAGLDGLHLARLLLRARRADRVVLVGAEPADEAATALYAADTPTRPLRAGAACVVLEPWRASAGRQVVVDLMPAAGSWPRPPQLVIGQGGFDPAAHWGDTYGAQGIVSLALAAHVVADGGPGVIGVRCDGDDGERAAMVSSVDSAVDTAAEPATVGRQS